MRRVAQGLCGSLDQQVLGRPRWWLHISRREKHVESGIASTKVMPIWRSLFHYLSVAVTSTATRSRPSLPVLTPQRSLPTFFRRFFERLGERYRLPAVLVFDNYQDVPRSAALDEWLPCAVSALPSHVSLVIISREPPAAPFAGLEAHRQLVRIGLKSSCSRPPKRPDWSHCTDRARLASMRLR